MDLLPFQEPSQAAHLEDREVGRAEDDQINLFLLGNKAPVGEVQVSEPTTMVPWGARSPKASSRVRASGVIPTMWNMASEP